MTPRQQLERIYDSYAELLFQYFHARTVCPEQARDLLQDFFIKLSGYKDGLCIPDGVLNEKAWLFTVARNLLIDHVRSADVRRRKTQAFASELQATSFFARSPNPDRAQFRNDLTEAMMALPEPQRTVVYLRLIAGLTFDEIAAAEQIPSNTAVSRYRYGIDKLRIALTPMYRETFVDP